MRLTILGSGTATPKLDRNCAGYLLEIDNNKLLFDSGAGTIRRLLELKVDLFEINYTFYTHLHNDHVNDLGAIIWSNNYGGIRKKALNFYGPVGFNQYYNVLIKKLLKPTKINFKINIKELKNSETEINGITVKTREVKHSYATKSIAYRIEHENKVLVYTGDTGHCTAAIDIAKDADVLLAECSFPDNKEAEGHLTPSLAGKIAANAHAKCLILTHFYPEVLRTDIKKSCSREFKGKVILAEDKMRIKV